MTDIALTLVENGFGISFDFGLINNDLATDDGLKTAVIISLFSDRRAADDDVIPDGTRDRRGCWMDAPLSSASAKQTDLLGSRLWLLERAVASQKTAALAKTYAEEALNWMIEDGVANTVSASAEWIGPGELALGILITRIPHEGALADVRFDFVWRATLSN